MRTAKYIIVSEFGHEQAIVFGELLTHKDVAGHKKVIAAGQVSFSILNWESDSIRKDHEIEISCYGYSTSCAVSSRGADDAKIIRKSLGM